MHEFVLERLSITPYKYYWEGVMKLLTVYQKLSINIQIPVRSVCCLCWGTTS
jgi:hypothetical protein